MHHFKGVLEFVLIEFTVEMICLLDEVHQRFVQRGLPEIPYIHFPQLVSRLFQDINQGTT